MTERMTEQEARALETAANILDEGGNTYSAEVVRNALTAIRQLQNPWQPIETAPRDGMFLISIPTAKKRKISLSRGGASGEAWFERNGYTIFDDHGNPVKATDWMPLPTPPETGQ